MTSRINTVSFQGIDALPIDVEVAGDRNLLMIDPINPACFAEFRGISLHSFLASSAWPGKQKMKKVVLLMLFAATIFLGNTQISMAAKASYFIDKIVNGDQELSLLNEKMKVLIDGIYNSDSYNTQFEIDQKIWLDSRYKCLPKNGVDDVAGCLKPVYETRIFELKIYADKHYPDNLPMFCSLIAGKFSQGNTVKSASIAPIDLPSSVTIDEITYAISIKWNGRYDTHLWVNDHDMTIPDGYEPENMSTGASVYTYNGAHYIVWMFGDKPLVASDLFGKLVCSFVKKGDSFVPARLNSDIGP